MGTPSDRVALLTAGHTGGHVFPLLAVVEELTERKWSVVFAGREASIEERLVRERGYDFHPVRVEPLVGRGPLGRLRTLLGLPAAIRTAGRLIGDVCPDVVLGGGAYVSAPAVLAARIAGVPSVILEINASPGIANHWLSRWASAAALANESAGRRMRCPTRTVGVPVRSEFFTASSGLPESNAPRLLVLGGSLGSTRINSLMPRALTLLNPAISGLRVLHQTGEEQRDSTAATYAETDGADLDVTTVGFLPDVASAIAESSLVVSTAGASSTAELCAVGRGALLLPLAVAGAHQVANASALAETGAAEVLIPAEATPIAIADTLRGLLADRSRLVEMGQRAVRLARPRAAAKVAEIVVSSARRVEGS